MPNIYIFFEGEEKPVQSHTYFLDTFNSIFRITVVSFIADMTLTVVVDWGDVFPNLEFPGSNLWLNEIFNGFPESLYASAKFLSD